MTIHNQVEMFGETEADVKFRKFHEANPSVYRRLRDLALKARSKGRKTIGIKMLIEIVRWDQIINTTDSDYKINNSYSSRYARLLMAENPELEDMFNVRDLRS